MPPYPNDTYDAGRTAHAPRPVDATASSGRNHHANPQYMPYRPRPLQTAPHETATYLQPPTFSATAGSQEAGQSAQQRNMAQDSSASPGRRPYPPLSPAHSREDLSMNRPSWQEHTKKSSARPVPYQTQSEHPVSAQSSMMPQRQVSDVGPGKKAHEIVDSTSSDIPDDDASRRESAMCDGCLNAIRCSQSRVQCTECYDYDLCISCFQLGRASKQHKNNHKVSHILSTQILGQDDLTPPRDVVNPEYNSEKTKVNWSIETFPTDPTTNGGKQGTQDWRMIHLHGNDSHARFLTSANPGHFAIVLYLELHISSLLSQEDRQMLQEEGIGWLRVSFGTLHNKKDFFTGRYREDTFDSTALTKDSLPHKLLLEYWYDVVRIPIGPQLRITSDAVISVEGRQGLSTDLGLILQWSGVRAFNNNNQALVQMTVTNIRYVSPHPSTM